MTGRTEVSRQEATASETEDNRRADKDKDGLRSRSRTFPDLDQIVQIRRALGLSQTQLASIAKVSQSTVAKIEQGKTVPSYAIAKRLFEALDVERRQRQREATIADVRSGRAIISVGPHTLLESAVAEMRRHKISQLPVMVESTSVGSLSERTVTNLILMGKSSSEFSKLRVRDVMEPPFPTLDEQAPVYLAAELLRHYSAVLVTIQGKIHGIVTRSDLLKLV